MLSPSLALFPGAGDSEVAGGWGLNVGNCLGLGDMLDAWEGAEEGWGGAESLGNSIKQ